MKWERPYSINYNGGVLRLTPNGEAEQTIVWQTANASTQQHSGGATFSAPTTDGRISWITVSSAGALIGAGVHGATSDPRSYTQCGTAQDGQVRSGNETADLRCRAGLYKFPDGSVGLGPEATIEWTYSDMSIAYDFSAWPFKSIAATSNTTTPNVSLTPQQSPPTITAGPTVNGRATLAFSIGSGLGPNFVIQDRKIIQYVYKTTAPAVVVDKQCGTF